MVARRSPKTSFPHRASPMRAAVPTPPHWATFLGKAERCNRLLAHEVLDVHTYASGHSRPERDRGVGEPLQ